MVFLRPAPTYELRGLLGGARVTLTTKEISTKEIQTFVPRHRCPQWRRKKSGLRTGNEEMRKASPGLMAEPLSAAFLIGLTAFPRAQLGNNT